MWKETQNTDIKLLQDNIILVFDMEKSQTQTNNKVENTHMKIK